MTEMRQKASQKDRKRHSHGDKFRRKMTELENLVFIEDLRNVKRFAKEDQGLASIRPNRKIKCP